MPNAKVNVKTNTRGIESSDSYYDSLSPYDDSEDTYNSVYYVEDMNIANKGAGSKPVILDQPNVNKLPHIQRRVCKPSAR